MVKSLFDLMEEDDDKEEITAPVLEAPVQVEAPVTEGPREGEGLSLFDLVETPSTREVPAPPARALPSRISPLLSPAQVAPSTAQPTTVSDPAEEEARPGHFGADFWERLLYGGGGLPSFLRDPAGMERIGRYFQGAKGLSEIGTAAMSSLYGIGRITGQEYKGILPATPKGMPLRSLFEVGRKYLADPVIGAGAALLGGMGMIGAPVAGAITEPLVTLFGEAGSAVAGEKGREWGEWGAGVAGGVAEVMAGYNVARGMSLLGRSITTRAAGRLFGGPAGKEIQRLAVLDLSDSMSPTLPRRPDIVAKAVDSLSGVPGLAKRLQKLRKPPKYGPTPAKRTYLETAPGDEMAPLGRVAVDIPAQKSSLLEPGVTPGQAVALKVGAKIENVERWLGQYAIWKFRLGAEYKAIFMEKEGYKAVGTLKLFNAHRRLTKRAKIMAKERGLSVDEIEKEQGLALKGLSTDPAMNKAVGPIRKEIDFLQKEFAKLRPEYADMVDLSLGEYLTRSYMSKIVPNVWVPSDEMKQAATNWFFKNYRKSVKLGDLDRAEASIALEAERAVMFRAFRESIKEGTQDVTLAQRTLAPLRKRILGSAAINLQSTKDMVKTVKNPGKIRDLVVEGLEERGYARDDAINITRDLIGYETRIEAKQKGKIIRLLTRMEKDPKKVKRATEAVEREVKLREGKDVLRVGTINREVVADVNKVLGDIRGIFDDVSARLKEIRKASLTDAEVDNLTREFQAMMQERFGPGPVRYKNLVRGVDDAFVEGQIKELTDGTAESLTYSRGGTDETIPLGPLMKRKDIPREIRALMGEIEEGPTAAAITINNLTQMIAGFRFLDRFAKGADLIRHPSYAGKTRVPWVRDQFAPGYKLLPEAEGWGPLKGKYVLEKYWADLNDFRWSISGQLGPAPKIIGTLEGPRPAQFAMAVFKISKTVLNPATHARNILGNTVFADFADISALNPLNWKYYLSAADELLKSGKGLTAEARRRMGGLSGDEAMTDVVRSAIEHGAIHTEFMGGEVLQDMAISLIKNKGQFGRTQLQQMQRPIKAIGRLYNAQDQIFKLASFIKQTSKGATAREAAKHVNTWFPNYRDVSQFIRSARVSYVGAPFITFTAEATRIFSNAARQHPIKFVKWMILPKAISSMAAAHLGLSDQDVEELRKSLPRYLDQPFTVIWPFRDKDGNVQIADGTFTHPFGAILGSQRHGKRDIPILGEFLFNNPIINTFIQLSNNLDFFTRRPIARWGDLATEEYTKKLLKDFLPPLLPFIGTGAKQIERAVKDQPGRWGIKKSVWGAVKGEISPIRLTPVSQEVRRAGALEKRAKMQELRRDYKNILREMRLGRITQAVGQAKIRRIKRDIEHFRKQLR